MLGRGKWDWRKAATLLVLVVAAACSRGPLVVDNIQTGRSLNSDNSVGNHGTRFKPNQTMYVSVITKTSGSGELAARWSFRGQVIQETKKNVSYRGEAATDFRLTYAGNLPAGEYTVEILVDGKSAGERILHVDD